MKILAVSSWFPYPADNGSRLRISRLLEALGHDHQVTLLTFGRPEGGESVEPLRSCCVDVEVLPLPPIDSRRLRGWDLLSPTPRYYLRSFSPALADRIAQRNAAHDLVIAFEILAAMHVARMTLDCPTVFEEAEIGAVLEAYRSAPTAWGRLRRWMTWWKHRRFVRTIVERFDLTTVVSDIERSLLEGIGCDRRRLVTVPNGAEIRHCPSRRIPQPQIIYPGSVRYSANLDAVRSFVNDVLPALRRIKPQLQFVVTGSTDDVDLHDLESVEAVTFTGRLDDVTPVLTESLVCVVPLRQGGGTRLKVLEAMGIGIPVVSTTKGIEGLDVEDERHLLVADTPSRMAEQILRIIDDPHLADALVAAARERIAERYTWPAVACRLLRAIEDVGYRGRFRARPSPEPRPGPTDEG